MSAKQRQIIMALRERIDLLSAKHHLKSRDGFDDELDKLQLIDHRAQRNPDEFFTALLPSNVPKNRFDDVLANQGTLVSLRPLTKTDPNPYINANYVNGRDLFDVPFTYIATQAPLQNTVVDFWRMVFDNSVFFIVMLCGEVEKGKVKSEIYWPHKGGELDFGTLRVRSLAEVCVDDLVFRSFTLRTQHGEERRVSHMQYLGWPDQGIPETSAPLMEIIQKMGKSEFSVQAPIIVHCSGGIGRTGVFIALHVALAQFQLERKDLDIQKIVHCLKRCRTGMVQRKDQYVFLYYAALREMNRMVLSAEKGVNLLKMRRRRSALEKNPRPRPPMNQSKAILSVPPAICQPQRPVSAAHSDEQLRLENYMKRRMELSQKVTSNKEPSLMGHVVTNMEENRGSGVAHFRRSATPVVTSYAAVNSSANLEKMLRHWQLENKKMRFSITDICNDVAELDDAVRRSTPVANARATANKLQLSTANYLQTQKEESEERMFCGRENSTSVPLERSVRQVSVIATPQETTTRQLYHMGFGDNKRSPTEFRSGSTIRSVELLSVKAAGSTFAAATESNAKPQECEQKSATPLFYSASKTQADTDATNRFVNLSAAQFIAKEEFDCL